MKNIFKVLAIVLALASVISCEKFLDRPSEDSFNVSGYYQNDAQLDAAVYYLYSSPWSDVTRFYIYGTETMAGNVYQSGSSYSFLSVNGTDEDLEGMSNSLWSINAHCNTVIKNIMESSGPSLAKKRQCIGECLTWKAMAYFLLVRVFGDVPIVHDNSAIIAEASYNQLKKVAKADVYDYIIMTLDEAIELLPVNPSIKQYNRIDKYAAIALRSKVYLAKAGVTGSLNNNDLKSALADAEAVITKSGRSLTPVYSDVFRLAPDLYQQTGECLISWLWEAFEQIWTCQSFIQNDVGLVGFSEENLWGDWKGPSVDLQDAFGVSAADNPTTRVNNDDRRKATIMMFGDFYDYFWQDKGGFDFYRFLYDETYGLGSDQPNISNKTWGCASGAQYAKHIYGNYYDHKDATGVTPAQQYNQLPTHILRLSDVYLIAAEAAVLTGEPDKALGYVNAVRSRANAPLLTSVTFDDIWKERRLELALEGDRWFDYVRRSYYDLNGCIEELLSQRRGHWDGGFDGPYKKFVCDAQGNYVGPGNAEPWDSSSLKYLPDEELTNVTAEMFVVTMPTSDVVANPNMASTVAGEHVDVRATYSYDFNNIME